MVKPKNSLTSHEKGRLKIRRVSYARVGFDEAAGVDLGSFNPTHQQRERETKANSSRVHSDWTTKRAQYEAQRTRLPVPKRATEVEALVKMPMKSVRKSGEVVTDAWRGTSKLRKARTGKVPRIRKKVAAMKEGFTEIEATKIRRFGEMKKTTEQADLRRSYAAGHGREWTQVFEPGQEKYAVSRGLRHSGDSYVRLGKEQAGESWGISQTSMHNWKENFVRCNDNPTKEFGYRQTSDERKSHRDLAL
ncbi:hypothetical protein C8R47DRAFT_1203325 [Mycena vitilis]|nr:hypothetical protein C8R47DRAFT_1203325 [Mycena vitilis]